MVTSESGRWSVWRILGIRVLIWAPQRKALFVGIGGDGSEGCSVLLVDKVVPIYMESAVNHAIQLREGLPREIRLYLFRRHPCHYSSNSALYPWMRMSTPQCFQGTKEKKNKTDPGENRDNSGIRRDFFFKLLISFKRLWKTLICKTKIDCHVKEVKRNNFHINRKYRTLNFMLVSINEFLNALISYACVYVCV